MKKTVVLTLALLLCCLAFLTSCGDKEKKEEQTETQDAQLAGSEDSNGDFNSNGWIGWDTTEN